MPFSINLYEEFWILKIYVPIIMSLGIIGNGIGLWTVYRQSLSGKRNISTTVTRKSKYKKRTVNSILMQLIFLVNFICCLVIMPVLFSLNVSHSNSHVKYLKDRSISKIAIENVVRQSSNDTLLNQLLNDNILLDYRTGMGLEPKDYSIYPFDITLDYKGCTRFFGTKRVLTKNSMLLLHYVYFPALRGLLTFSLYLSVIFIIDQCIALAYPFKYRTWSKPNVIRSVIIGCLIFSVIWSYSLTFITIIEGFDFSFISTLVKRVYFAKETYNINISKNTRILIDKPKVKDCENWFFNRILNDSTPNNDRIHHTFNKTIFSFKLHINELSQNKKTVIIYGIACELFSRILPFVLAATLKIIVIYKLKSLKFGGFTHSKLFTANLAKDLEYAQLGIEPINNTTATTAKNDTVKQIYTINSHKSENNIKCDKTLVIKDDVPIKLNLEDINKELPISKELLKCKEPTFNDTPCKVNNEVKKESLAPSVNSARFQRLANETQKNTTLLIIFIFEFIIFALPISIFYVILPFIVTKSNWVNILPVWIILFFTEYLYISLTFYLNFAFNKIFRQNVIKACSKQNTRQISPSAD